jgi:type IX secretion system PorP/SprF family membrane protein
MRQIIFIFIFSLTTLYAQDPHFSQFNIAKLNLNPSLTALISSDYQTLLHRKSQWGSVTDPFKTLAISFYAKEYYKQLSFGFNFIHDESGLSSFNTTGMNTSISKSIINKNNSIISIGTLIGAYQRSIDYTSIIFLEEEQFYNDNLFFLDFALGGVLSQKINNKNILEFGLSAYHLNQPQQSFNTNIDSKMPVKFNTHLTGTHILSSDFLLNTLFFYSEQQNVNELLYGMDLISSIDNTFLDEILVGVLIRDDDAIIPKIGFVFEKFHALLSYDVNISKLSKASNNYGGLEFSLIYSWSTKKPILEKKYICPKYL